MTNDVPASSALLGIREVLANPYPFYDMLRPEPQFVAPLGLWFITGFDDAAAVLRDRRLVAFTPRRWQQSPDAAEEDQLRKLEYRMKQQMMYLQRLEHTRVRGLVSDLFAPREIDRLRPLVEDVAERAVSAAAEHSSVDFVAEVARQVPIRLTAALLGIDAEAHPVEEWCVAIARGVDLVVDVADVVAANNAMDELDRLLRDVIAERRLRPSDDLLSRLVDARKDGVSLGADEIVSLCVQLLGAYETTMNLTCNALIALAQNPGQEQLLRDDPALLSSTIEEVLRFESPVQITSRRALEPVVLGSTEVEPGTEIAIVIGAANRDPLAYDEPMSFNIMRPAVKHLTFGHGPHVCLGAALARAEASAVLRRVILEHPGWQLVNDEVSWRPSVTLRGPERLEIAFAA